MPHQTEPVLRAARAARERLRRAAEALKLAGMVEERRPLDLGATGSATWSVWTTKRDARAG